MIRTIWFYLSFITATLILCVATLLPGFLAPGGKICGAFATLWSRYAVLLSGIRIEADLSAIPTEGPVVFMVNHQSQFDIPITTLLLNKYYPAFVAKKSLFNIPIIGWAFRVGGHIPVERENSRKAMKSIEKAASIAKGGRSILIYPEGTRQLDTSKLGNFKTGGIILALKTELPIVPIVMEGAGDILPKGHITLKPRQRVQVRALPPVDASSYTLKERNTFRDDLYTMMNNAYLEMRTCRTNLTS